jgi:hypothetical protein
MRSKRERRRLHSRATARGEPARSGQLDLFAQRQCARPSRILSLCHDAPVQYDLEAVNGSDA